MTTATIIRTNTYIITYNKVVLIKTRLRIQVLRAAPDHVVLVTEDALLMLPKCMTRAEPPFAFRHA